MTTNTPQDTINLMASMLADGVLTDSMFRQMHPRGRGILRHHKYLLKRKTYKSNGYNLKLHQRLASLYAEFKDMRGQA